MTGNTSVAGQLQADMTTIARESRKWNLSMGLYCPTQGGVNPPPLGGGFSISCVGCGHECLSPGLSRRFFDSSAPGLDNQVSEKGLVRRHCPASQGADTRHPRKTSGGNPERAYGSRPFHLFVSMPPNLAVSKLMRQLKGGTSHAMLNEFHLLRRQYWGRHMWARGYLCCGSGNVTDEVIKQYIAHQEDADEIFRIAGERL